jgi:hypothetical protein
VRKKGKRKTRKVGKRKKGKRKTRISKVAPVDIGENLVLLLLQGLVDLIGGKCKTIPRLETHERCGVPEQRSVKLNIDPENGPPLPVHHSIVSLIARFPIVLQPKLVCSHHLPVNLFEGPLC